MTADPTQLVPTTQESDDLDLVHASKNGDVAAFEQLIKRYDRKLFRIAQHVTHNREDSEDAVQESEKWGWSQAAHPEPWGSTTRWVIRHRHPV
jgi:RNA polymerase sigma-70 factor (ECF subfamily)